MICEVSGRDCPTLDEHHVIPREYGGVDGPTIKLDPAIHQAIHRYVGNGTKLASFLSDYPVETRARIQMLVTAIQHARATLGRALSYSVTCTLSEVEYSKLTELARDVNMTESKVAAKLLSNILS